MKLPGCDTLHCYETTWLRQSALLWNYVVATLCIAMKLRGCDTLHCYETTVSGFDTLHCQGIGIAVDCSYKQNNYETSWLQLPVSQRNNIVAAPGIPMKQHCCNIFHCRKLHGFVVKLCIAMYKAGWVWHLTLQQNYMCEKSFIATPLTAILLHVLKPCIVVQLHGRFKLNCCKTASCTAVNKYCRNRESLYS
jgi:hypothetical protein